MLAARARTGLAILTGVLMYVPMAARQSPRTREVTAEDILPHACPQVPGAYELEGTVVDTKLAVRGTLVMRGASRRTAMDVRWNNGVDFHLVVADDVVTVDQGVVGGIRDVRVLAGAARDEARVDVTPDCDWRHVYERAEVVGTVDFAGERAYEVVLTTASGVTRTRYISVFTRLALGEDYDVTTPRVAWEPAGPPHVDRARFSFSDYREVAGELVPFRIEQTPIGGDYLDPMTIVLDRVTSAPAPRS